MGEFINDTELFEKLKKKNSAAIKEVIKRFNKPLYVSILKRTDSEIVAQEILNRVFSEMWKTLEKKEEEVEKNKITDINGIRNFLFNRSKVRIIDHYRRTSTKKKYISALLNMESDKYSIEKDIDHANILNIVFKEIEKSHPELLKMFKLVYLEHKSKKEAAKILDMPYSTFKNQINKAIKDLKIIFKGKDPLTIVLLLLLHNTQN